MMSHRSCQKKNKRSVLSEKVFSLLKLSTDNIYGDMLHAILEETDDDENIILSSEEILIFSEDEE